MPIISLRTVKQQPLAQCCTLRAISHVNRPHSTVRAMSTTGYAYATISSYELEILNL
ncbi:MAG: hypothetical protein HWQ38_36290 [Nostoc sp. NMS7]|uniref:hypothetical protein n=1 Tax=Nostoc sp. NMS7 TaxID=2815391 RepID=UPI0025D9F0A9|nr:hypothetical protein [Nostoc sp. NMS7]MBN3951632.1 hypothetical protein [Nostoc sp. NMS7]